MAFYDQGRINKIRSNWLDAVAIVEEHIGARLTELQLRLMLVQAVMDDVANDWSEVHRLMDGEGDLHDMFCKVIEERHSEDIEFVHVDAYEGAIA